MKVTGKWAGLLSGTPPAMYVKDKAITPKCGIALTAKCDKALIPKGAAPSTGVFLPKLTTHFISMWLSAGYEQLFSAGGSPFLVVETANFPPAGPALIAASRALKAGTACVPETFPQLGCCPPRGLCLQPRCSFPGKTTCFIDQDPTGSTDEQGDRQRICHKPSGAGCSNTAHGDFQRCWACGDGQGKKDYT